jgi:hypothetical protein
MKSSWVQTFRRLAAGCIIGGSVAWSSAMCYAVQVAYDTSSDPVYADGWQGTLHDNVGNLITSGDNGGSGFTTAWDFDSGYWWPYNAVFYPYAGQPDAHMTDNGLKSGTQFSNPFNDIGTPAINGNNRTWVIARRSASEGGGVQTTDGVPRAGRGFPALQTGQTLSVVVDTPAQLPPFNGGFWVQLNTNTQPINGATGQHGNICQGGRSCYYVNNPAAPGTMRPGSNPKPALELMNWNYNGGFGFGYGKVYAIDSAGKHDTGLFNYDTTPPDTSTSNGGIRIDVTMTSATTYSLAITRLANPGSPAFTSSGTFNNILDGGGNPRPVDWIQISHVGNLSDTGSPPTTGTDLYIRSIAITTPGTPGDNNGDGKVDAADYVLWRKNPSAFGGDPAGYNTWRTNFGIGTGSGLVSGAVPEPGTFVYMVTMAAGAAGTIRRRRS